MPLLDNPKQKLIGAVDALDKDTGLAKVGPYKELVSTEGEWCYWLVGLERPVYKGEIVEIGYAQEFYDARKSAKPYLNFIVNSSMKMLELNVKYPDGMLPATVIGNVFRLNDRRHGYPSKDVIFDRDKQGATWVIRSPKFGRPYRIDWQ